MQELSNFSIETDSTVLLVFKDGTELRVPRRSLGKYLSKADIEKVRTAYKLRRDFLRSHMPRLTAYLVLSVALAALLALTGRSAVHAVSGMVQRMMPTTTGTPAQDKSNQSIARPASASSGGSTVAPATSATPRASSNTATPATAPATIPKVVPSRAPTNQMAPLTAPVTGLVHEVLGQAGLTPATPSPAVAPKGLLDPITSLLPL